MGILGLCSIVLASRYDIPCHIPKVLMKLCAHHDSWHEHRKQFTDDQRVILTDIEIHITFQEPSSYKYTIRHDLPKTVCVDNRPLICYRKPVIYCAEMVQCCTKCVRCCTNCIAMDLGPNDNII
ncbi:hypothetical protein I4U23_005553 [Adineta vaga]|nr:hypothetical protein I4U23_005553 [Adineta vaga]